VTHFSTRRFRLIVTPLVLAIGASLSCMRATASAEGAPLSAVPVAAPKLVVMITVDQLRGDMLERHASQLRSGYARLMRGAWYVRAFQDHAITETAPGHASLMSGRFPRSTGIASNSVGVVDPNYRLLVGLPNEMGASPFRFQGTTLFDWIHAKDNRARAFSVSTKDRGAILTIGRSKQNVYWYSASGNFTTSNYYRDTLPAWVTSFNARRLAQRYADAEWRLLRDSTAYLEPDSVPFENRGVNVVFPHRFPPDSANAASVIRATPSMDSLTALFALEGVRQLELGTGPQTDVLAVSFSATDYVGHAYGPDSREAHDNELRLDQTIGWFLDSLYRLRDSSSVIIALSGDHGVQPIPELARQRGEATGDQGLRVSLRQVLLAFRGSLHAAGADSNALLYDGELVGFDRAALSRARLNADSVISAFAAAVKQVRGVARVDRVSAIRRADFALDAIARRWSHQIPESSAVDLVITLTRFSLWGSGITATHGSPYDQDAHVPIIFYGPWASPGRYTEFARTVDIAPTLAAMIGVTPAEKLDGRVLVKAVMR
jgi:predicted AlkP superfamily pyrophosphatase or phosphodiesterase